MEFLNGKDSFAFLQFWSVNTVWMDVWADWFAWWNRKVAAVWSGWFEQTVVCYWKELGAICPTEKLVNFCPTKNDNIFEPAPLSVISHKISFTSALSLKQSAMCGALSEQNSKKEQDNLNSQRGNALLIKLQLGNSCGWREACVVLKSRPASQSHCCLWILLC